MAARFHCTVAGTELESTDALEWTVLDAAPDAPAASAKRALESFARLTLYALDEAGNYLPDRPAAAADGLCRAGFRVFENPGYTQPQPDTTEEVVY